MRIQWLDLSLPLPPPINRQYHGSARGGRLILSDESRTWKQLAGLLLNQHHLEPTLDPVSVSLTFYRPQRSGDIDNRIKITLDVLQGHFYVNDSQVAVLHVINSVDRANPRVEIRVARLPEEQ